jgi:hypothetical protein
LAKPESVNSEQNPIFGVIERELLLRRNKP